MTDRGLDKVLFERNNQRASIYLKSLRARFLKEDAQKIIYELIQIDSYIGKIDNKLHLIDHQDQNALLNLLYSSNYIDIKSLKERLLNCANSLSSVALDYQLLIQFLTIKVLCLTGDFEDANMLLDKINIAKYLDNGSKLAFKSGNRMLADCFKI